jgi:hypothetical protein
MLGSVLPGLRELRAPLAAGYLWLLAGWLILADELPTKHEAKPAVIQRFYDLAPVVSAFGLAVVASVAAYVIGSIALDIQSRLIRWLSLWARPFVDRYGFPVSDEGSEALRNAVVEHVPYDPNIVAWGKQHLSDNRELVMTRLLAASEPLHAQVDRPDAEATFRAGLWPPLTVIIVYLAITVSPWWWGGLWLPAMLIWQRAGLRRRANDALVIAVISREEINRSLLTAVKTALIRNRTFEAVAGLPGQTSAETAWPGSSGDHAVRKVDLDVDGADFAHRAYLGWDTHDGRRLFEVRFDSDFSVSDVIDVTDDKASRDEESTVAAPSAQEPLTAPGEQGPQAA